MITLLLARLGLLSRGRFVSRRQAACEPGEPLVGTVVVDNFC